jgi:acetolactate synthase I/II/III large subunit
VIRHTRTTRPHDFMKNVGGSIGFGMPAAIGAAIACPDRKVLCLEADGSAMYTVQALWTQARERLNITTVIFANRTYATLKTELANVQAGKPGPKALDMLDIARPDLDWCAIAAGMGVAAARVGDMDGFNRELAAGLRSNSPHLIEVMM